jgi:hypothetical protein
MKSAIFGFIALVVGCFSFPVFAQDVQELTNAIKAISAQEREMIKTRTQQVTPHFSLRMRSW